MPTNNFVNKPKLSINNLPEKGMKQHDFINDFKQYYVHLLGRDENLQLPFYEGKALSLAIRDRLMDRWKVTHQTYKNYDCRRGYYLSMEYLIGRTLSNAMLNLGVTDTVTQAMYDLGIEIEELITSEHDAGLGNGGLGRL
ncbi:MAG: glycogen phosphorylase, partial [Methylococcaceae bacterium]